VVIEDNLVRWNRAGDHGGGIYAGGLRSTFEITSNLVVLNEANAVGTTGESGGGVWVGGEGGTVRHNTLVLNRGSNVATGGGLAVASGTPIIEANIVAHSQIGGGIRCVRGGEPLVRNNLFWNPRGEEDQGCEVDWESQGNLVADPLFCDLDSEVYTLAQNSPALLHPAGPLGVFPTPGCSPVQVIATTWGRLKAQYGLPGRP
jgi:hypothetical protein